MLLLNFARNLGLAVLCCFFVFCLAIKSEVLTSWMLVLGKGNFPFLCWELCTASPEDLTLVFPEPVGPTSMRPCRTTVVSYS